MNPIDSNLLTRRQAALELDVTVRTIDRHRSTGTLKPYISPVGHGRGGTRIWFRREEIEALKKPIVAEVSK